MGGFLGMLEGHHLSVLSLHPAGYMSATCSYSGELKVVLTTVPTASKLLIKFSINVLTVYVCNINNRTANSCTVRLNLFIRVPHGKSISNGQQAANKSGADQPVRN